MKGEVLIASAVLMGLAGLVVLALRQGFMAHLDELEAQSRRYEEQPGHRLDLPPSVLALAKRLGSRAAGGVAFAMFDQTGHMWGAPSSQPMTFSARQTVNARSSQFLWRAAIGPGRIVVVADYLVAGTGGLEVRLLGAVPLARMVGGAGMNQGEALRYLAELPWNPDAILSNRSLDGTVMGPREIKVATGSEPERSEVTFDLDENGLIVVARAASRLYADRGRMTPHPWRGRFWDYDKIDGRLIPRQAEVAWALDGQEFVYWRGRIRSWKQSPPGATALAATPGSDHQFAARTP